MARSKLAESDIQAIVHAEIINADGFSSSSVSEDRGDNMDYYQGAPFGNEIEGRSSVVSRDVMEIIEWMLPILIRIFTSGEDVVAFEPENPNDVAGAKQATEYVNFIWNSDNEGFLNFYSWFKDALLSKNGIIKIWWDDTPKTKREHYTGLDDAAFAQVAAGDDVEVSEHTERKEKIQTLDPQTMQPVEQEITVHDLVITRKIPGGKVCIETVPPEEFLISKEGRDIPNARMVGHRKQVTLSSLKEDGVSDEVLSRLSGDDGSVRTNAEEIKRNTVETTNVGSSTALNEAMKLVWRTETWIDIDVDGDGIAETRKITVVGPESEIIDNVAWDTPRPLVSLTPIIQPHRFWGFAVADLVKDLQLIKSTIMRQYLDNLYLQTNQREQVIENNIIDPQEVLSSKPGQKIRIKNGEAVFPISSPDVGAIALEGLNYVDQVLENRTGISARTQGLGADALHETASGERMLMSAAQGKLELIARVFAETGVKAAFRLILKLICEYQDKPRTIRLTDNWVDMDPRSWNADMDMRASVGLGMGDRDQQMQHAQILGNAQAQAATLGFVSPENFRNSAELLINGMGLKGVDRFFSFPQDPQASKQPVKIPPKGAGHQVDPQVELQKAQIAGQTAAQVAQIKAQSEQQIANAKAQAQAATDNQHHQIEAQQDTLHNQQQMQLEAYKAKVEGALELAIAHIRAAAQIESSRITAKADDGAAAYAKESAGEAA